MQSVAVTAAQAAGARAETCRYRAYELAHHRRTGIADVVRARAALELASQRAAFAQERLHQTQAAYRRRIEMRAALSRGPTDCLGVAELRMRAREVSLRDLYVAYMSVGGHCDEFELDAFVHSVIELPYGELAILGQAVWELTEF